MPKTPSFLTTSRRFALAALLALSLPLCVKAQDDFGIIVQTSQDGNQVKAELLVQNFENIIGMQFKIMWDVTVMQFESVTEIELAGATELANFGTGPFNVDQGKLPLSWTEPALNPLTYPDCFKIFQVNFTSINGQASPITVGADLPTFPVEIIYSGDIVVESLIQLSTCENAGKIEGKIFHDTNGNCQQDEGEAGVPDCQVKVKLGSNTYFVDANDEGEYEYPCAPGSYELTAILPENLTWVACQPTSTVEVTAGQFVVHDFGVNPPSNPSGIGELQEGDFFANLSPNPVAAGQPLRLDMEAGSAHTLKLQAFDATGRQWGQWVRQVPAGPSSQLVDVALGQGVYFVKIVDEDGRGHTVRLVVF